MSHTARRAEADELELLIGDIVWLRSPRAKTALPAEAMPPPDPVG